METSFVGSDKPPPSRPNGGVCSVGIPGMFTKSALLEDACGIPPLPKAAMNSVNNDAQFPSHPAVVGYGRLFMERLFEHLVSTILHIVRCSDESNSLFCELSERDCAHIHVANQICTAFHVGDIDSNEDACRHLKQRFVSEAESGRWNVCSIVEGSVDCMNQSQTGSTQQLVG